MLTFRQLLDPRILTASYAQRDGLRSYLLSDTFMAGTPEQIDGNEYELIYYPAMMEPAPINAPGGTARVLQVANGSSQKAVLMCAFNQIDLPMQCFDALREPDSLALQKQGRTSIGRILADFRERHKLLKEVYLSKVLSSGVVYANRDGVILESSSGAVVTADYNVPANRKTNLGGIIDAEWDVAGTKIGTHLDNIRLKAEEDNVEAPTEIYINSVWKTYLRNNTEFKDWAAHNNRVQDVVLRGEVIEDLWGFNWHFYNGKYKASDGSTKSFIPETKAIICPKVGPWLRHSTGSTMVPKSIGVASSAEEALNQIQTLYGEFAYAKVMDNPVHLAAFIGDKFGIHFAEPNAIWMPTINS